MIHWGYILGIGVCLLVISIIVFRRWRVCTDNELELFEIMSNECIATTVSSTPVVVNHNLLTISKGVHYTLTGKFENSTLHILPRTDKGNVAAADIVSIKFGCWQSVCEINKVEIVANEDKEITITAHNKSTHASQVVTLANTSLGLYHYVPSSATIADNIIKIIKT